MGYFFFILVITLPIWLKVYFQYAAEQKERERELAKEETASMITFSEASHTATLRKRNYQIDRVVTIEEAKNYSVTHEPETLHYGSVTVGGVTTGGTYKTGGYNYVSGSSSSGYYDLNYDGHSIFQINLSEELFDQAKKSPIADYLDDEKRCIEVHTAVNYTEEEKYMILASLNYRLSFKKGYPTKAKCEKILRWICGADS